MGSSNHPLRQRLYWLSFVDEFVPFVVLFTLWFDDNGVSVGQLSVAFVIWSVGVLLMEVPSGALADRVDRRRLLAVAFGLRIVAVGVWLVWPSFAGLLLGTALFALHDAAASGAWEALIHDQLEAIDDDASYGVVMARVGQFGHAGFSSAALVATPLLGLGLSLTSLGVVSMALQTIGIVLVLALPDVRWVVKRSRADAAATDAEGDALVGVREALANRRVLIPALVGSFLGGLAVVDEYVPLLARQRGLDDTWVPLAFLAVWVGLIAGGEIAARAPDLKSVWLAAFVVTGGVSTLVGLATDSVWTIGLFSVLYAAIETTWVISDARMQQSVPAHVRATVTSVREVGAGVVFGVAVLGIAAALDGDDPTPGLIAVVATLTVGAFGVAALPDAIVATPEEKRRRADPLE